MTPAEVGFARCVVCGTWRRDGLVECTWLGLRGVAVQAHRCQDEALCARLGERQALPAQGASDV